MKKIATLWFCIVFLFSSTAFASKKPLPPKIIKDYQSRYIKIYLPQFLDDNQTKIQNLYKLLVYVSKDEQILKENIIDESFQPGDSLLIDINFESLNGFYNVTSKLIIKQDNVNYDTSNFSNEIVIYNIEDFQSYYHSKVEEFETNKMYYDLYLSKNWQKTQDIFKSPNTSITNSQNKKYSNSQFDTIIIPIVDIPSIPEAPTYISEINFWQIAHLDKSDSIFIECSQNLADWNLIKTISAETYTNWQDTILNNNDWKYESIDVFQLYNSFYGIQAIRLRFQSDSDNTNFGWFIDDFQIDTKTVGVESDENTEPMAIYPNPANDVLYLDNKSNYSIRNIELISLQGTTHLKLNESEVTQTTKLDTKNLTPGRYILKITDSKGKTTIQQFGVVR